MGAAWERDTRVRATIALRPDLLAAMRAHLDLHELSDAEAQALVCFETVSRRTGKPSRIERKAGGGHMTMTQAVVVTPTRLIWAQAADERETLATSELLARLEVTDYEKGPAYGLIPDHGVEIAGIAGPEGRVGTLFFGLGEGPDADRARHMPRARTRRRTQKDRPSKREGRPAAG